jgi:cobalt-zinc-cadmium efflux system outer membrane protein
MKKYFSLFILIFLLEITVGYSQVKLGLKQAMNLAKENNINVKTYRYNVAKEKTDIVTAGLRPNPIFNQQSIFLWDRKYLDAIGPNVNLVTSPYSRQTWFQLTKQYQLAGQRKSKINFQTKDAQFYEKDVAEYANNVVYQTAQKWLDVWYAQVSFGIISLGKKNIDTLLGINKIRLEKQVIPREEYLRNKIVAEKYATSLISAKQLYRTEIQKLQFLINTRDSIAVESDEALFNEGVLFNNGDSLLSYALKNRPDILSDKAFQEATVANINMQKALSYPTPEFGLVTNPQNIQPYAGWYFQMPLSIFSRNQGEIQKAKISTIQAQSQIDATTSLIKNEITYSLQEYEVNKANVEKYKEIVANANEVLKVIKYSYLRGGTSFLDFLNAQSTWYETQKSYYDAILVYRKSYLQLLFVTGLLTSNN